MWFAIMVAAIFVCQKLKKSLQKKALSGRFFVRVIWISLQRSRLSR